MNRRDFLKAAGASLAIGGAAQDAAHRGGKNRPNFLFVLADKSQYADAKKRLLGELRRWMAEQNDPGAAMDDPEVHAANRQAGVKKP